MRKPADSKKLKPHIISENCKGCGVCIVGCEQDAMHYEIVRPPEYMKAREFKFPAPQPSKSGRRIPVNVRVGPYGGFYDLD